jgi:hypothetical protein
VRKPLQGLLCERDFCIYFTFLNQWHASVPKVLGFAVRPDGGITSGGRFHPESCRFDLVADERFGRATGWIEAS